MSKKRNIYDSAVETFEISCFLFPVDKEDEKSDWHSDDAVEKIRSEVNFNGATEGKVVIIPSHSLLDAMAANMLGVENPAQQQKEEALCEVANIITGNIAPIFSSEDAICYIEPPKLIEGETEVSESLSTMAKESVSIHLDAGKAEIEVYYKTGEEQ